MLNFKLPRKLKRLMQHYPFSMDDVGDDLKLELTKQLKREQKYYNLSPTSHQKDRLVDVQNKLKIYRFGKEYGLSVIDTEIRWAIVREDLIRLDQPYHRYGENKKMPKLPKQDNKGHYHGSGSGGSNRVRYPKKNRSKKVWKTFYDMFPRYAEVDGWDGEKSSRYNPKKKKK